MDRSKRNAKKPSRYQTTSSENEDSRIRSAGKETHKRNTEKITDAISRDINELQKVVGDSSNNSYHMHNYSNTQHTHNVIDMQPQPSNYVQYFSPPQESNENILPMPIHNTASYEINESQIEQATAPDSRCAFLSNESSGNIYTNLDVHHASSAKRGRFEVAQSSHTDNTDNREVYESNGNTYTDVHHASAKRARFEIVQSNPSSDNTDQREVSETLHRIEREMRKFNNILDHILKSMQRKQRRVVRKPDCLPISTVAELIAFETVNEETYEDVVSYFETVGGFTVKEAINLSFKEGIKDDVMKKFTWFGREENVRPLYNSRIILAIYDAVCNNQQFQKPTRAEFQVNAREALRASKQRYRTSIRKPKEHEQRNMEARNHWNNAESENEQRSRSSDSMSEEENVLN